MRLAVTRSSLASLVVLAAALLAAPSLQADPRSGRWAHEGARLAPDPAVRWGKLDNGLRYALRPHHGIPGRVSIRLVVLAGSLDETPEEAGIAHFIEHLAFRGTAQFPRPAMTALFERLGIEWGADVNAVTTFDYTAYTVDFRENDPALLEDGLRLLRGFAGDVTFNPADIEQERRVILAELRSRDGIAVRQQADATPLVFRGLRFPERNPGGRPERILAFQQEDFLRFYRRLYRPDLMVVVAAGDFDGDTLARRLAAVFGDLPRPRGPVPPRDEGRLAAGRGVRAGVFRTSVPGEAAVLLASVTPPAGRADARESVLERQRRRFAVELLDQRLRTVPGLGGADASREAILGHEAVLVTAGVPVEGWGATLGTLDRAVRRAVDRGFEAAEIEAARRRLLRQAALMLDQAPRADAGAVVEALTESIVTHTVYLEPERAVGWLREWLDRVTPRELQASLRALWNPEALAVHLAGGLPIDVTAETVAQRLQQSRRTGAGSHVSAEEVRAATLELPAPGIPGIVAERREVPDLGAVLLRWSNQVRTTLVPRTGEPRVVRAAVRVGAGLLTLPENQAALKEFGLGTVLAGGTAFFNAEQMSAFVRERFLGFSFDVQDHDAFTFRAAVPADRLEEFLGIVAAFLHRPRFSGAVHEAERRRAAQARGAAAVGPAEGQRRWTGQLFRGDGRFEWASPLDYLALGIGEVRAWLEEPLTRGYVEATIVGDFEPAEAEAAVARTLGALGPRAAAKEAPAPRPVRVTQPAGTARLEFVGENHLALTLAAWPVEGELTVRDEAALHVLARILEGRLVRTVRETDGLTYAPAVQFVPLRGFPGFALLEARMDCGPAEADRLAARVLEVADALAREGVEEGEWLGARGVLRQRLRLAFDDNEFLVQLLQRVHERPGSLEDARALAAGLVGEVRREEVSAWAGRVLPAAQGRAAAAVPKQLIGILDVPGP